MQEYDTNKVFGYLRQRGFSGKGIINYWQDSTGRALYFPDGDLRDHVKGHTVFLLTQERKDPIQVVIPPETYADYWIDPKGTLRFLPSYLPPIEQRVREGTLDCSDVQSPFFFETTRDGVIRVGSYERLDGWLFTTHETSEFHPHEIVARGDVVYLVDNTDIEKPAGLHSLVNCWAFGPDPKDPTKYAKVDEFSVCGQPAIVDPFSPRCICRAYGSWPFGGSYFLYNTETHSTLGALPGGTVLTFLDCDWLGPRL
jgi:hypothetical protein